MAENDDAVITYSTEIHYSETEEGDYKKLFDAKDYPDDSEAEELDITTLSDPAFRSIPGIDANEARPYTANYTKAKYDELKALEGKLLYFMEIFGPDGVDGKFKFSGRKRGPGNGNQNFPELADHDSEIREKYHGENNHFRLQQHTLHPRIYEREHPSVGEHGVQHRRRFGQADDAAPASF